MHGKGGIPQVLPASPGHRREEGGFGGSALAASSSSSPFSTRHAASGAIAVVGDFINEPKGSALAEPLCPSPGLSVLCEAERWSC